MTDTPTPVEYLRQRIADLDWRIDDQQAELDWLRSDRSVSLKMWRDRAKDARWELEKLKRCGRIISVAGNLVTIEVGPTLTAAIERHLADANFVTQGA